LTEVLCALLLITIGLLGIAGLQSQSFAFSQHSYLQTQADLLIHDLIDSIRANRLATKHGAYQQTTGQQTALANNTSYAFLARKDLQAWHDQLQQSGLPNVQSLVNCLNCGQSNALVHYRIAVSWDPAPTVHTLINSNCESHSTLCFAINVAF